MHTVKEYRWEYFELLYRSIGLLMGSWFTPISDQQVTTSYTPILKSCHQVEVFILIQRQIPVANLQRNELLLKGRINNQILGVKALKESMSFKWNI